MIERQFALRRNASKSVRSTHDTITRADKVYNRTPESTMARVLVGPEEEPFKFYKHDICSKSIFVENHSKRRPEEQKIIVRLPEVQHATFVQYFKLFNKWKTEIVNCTATSAQKAMDDENTMLIDLYLLSVRLGDDELRKKTITMLFKALRNQNSLPSLNILTPLYASTRKGSPLREMMVEVILIVGKDPSQDCSQSLSEYASQTELQNECMKASFKYLQAGYEPTWSGMGKKVSQYRKT